MGKRFLIFCTDSYPFDDSEDYAAGMLEVFSKHFHKIYVLVPEEGYSKKNSVLKLPENCLVVQFNLDVAFTDRFLHMPYWLSRIYWRELTWSRKFRNDHAFRIIRDSLRFLKRAERFKKILRNFLKGSHIPGSRTYFYSLNFSCYLLGAVRLARRNRLAGVFAETTSWGNKIAKDYSPFRSYILRYMNGLFYLSEATVDRINYLRPGFERNGWARFSKATHPFHAIPEHQPFRVLSYGKLVEETGIKSLVEALDSINDTKIEWVHFGEADDPNNLRQYAFNHLFNKSNIQFKFLHDLSPDVLIKWLSEHTASLYISLNTTVEQRLDTVIALTAGLPCLLIDGPHTRDIYGDSAAVVYLNTDFDTRELSSAIEDFAKMKQTEWLLCTQAAHMLAEHRFRAEDCYNQMVYHIIQMGQSQHA